MPIRSEKDNEVDGEDIDDKGGSGGKKVNKGCLTGVVAIDTNGDKE